MKTEKQKMVAGEMYNPFVPELIEGRNRARQLTRTFNQSLETDNLKRTELLKELFGSSGKDLFVEPSFRWTMAITFMLAKILC